MRESSFHSTRNMPIDCQEGRPWSIATAPNEEGGWRLKDVMLWLTNPKHSQIILTNSDAATVQLVSEFMIVLRGLVKQGKAPANTI